MDVVPPYGHLSTGPGGSAIVTWSYGWILDGYAPRYVDATPIRFSAFDTAAADVTPEIKKKGVA